MSPTSLPTSASMARGTRPLSTPALWRVSRSARPRALESPWLCVGAVSPYVEPPGVRIETAGIVGNPPSTRDSRRCIWLLIWICLSFWLVSFRAAGWHTRIC